VLDLNTAAGREAFRKIEQQIFDDLKIGSLTDLTVPADQILGLLGDGADALNSFTSATNAAVASLTNVPQGFKLGLLPFNSTLGLADDAAAKGLGILPRTPFDPTHPRGGILTNTVTTTGIGVQNVNVTFAPRAIVQQPGEDGVALAQRVVRTLRDQARAQTGDSLDFGRLV
jgi:hypothetical protein